MWKGRSRGQQQRVEASVAGEAAASLVEPNSAYAITTHLKATKMPPLAGLLFLSGLLFCYAIKTHGIRELRAGNILGISDHCSALLCLVSDGQTGGCVDRQVSLLRQSDQGDVVTVSPGIVVVSMKDDQVHLEILRDQRLVYRVQLVLTKPDLQ